MQFVRVYWYIYWYIYIGIYNWYMCCIDVLKCLYVLLRIIAYILQVIPVRQDLLAHWVGQDRLDLLVHLEVRVFRVPQDL